MCIVQKKSDTHAEHESVGLLVRGQNTAFKNQYYVRQALGQASHNNTNPIMMDEKINLTYSFSNFSCQSVFG